ncbi:hypothetical protein AB0D24_43120 [Streptomyces javensis]|uniref:hypothetical protein n=1 Tax=Streptomyces javensis TaxID=114698 RepID=UPI0033CCB068
MPGVIDGEVLRLLNVLLVFLELHIGVLERRVRVVQQAMPPCRNFPGSVRHLPTAF